MERPGLLAMNISSIQKQFRQRLIYTGCLASMLLSACTASIHTPYNSRASALIAQSTSSLQTHSAGALFDYEKQRIDFDNHDAPYKKHTKRKGPVPLFTASAGSGYQLKYIQFPALRDNGQKDKLIRIRYYKYNRKNQDRGKNKTPLIIIVPIYGSYVYPSEVMTKQLLGLQPRANVALLEYHQNLLDFESLATAQTEADVLNIFTKRIRDRIVAGVIDVRQVIDWAEQQTEIDPGRIALVTFSMSALVGTLAAFHEPRLTAGVIVMGAAQPYDVLSVCQGRPGIARATVQERFGWTQEQYREHMFRIFRPLDPVIYAGMANPARILMIDAELDDCMPKQSRDALWESLGRPERISYRYSHKKAFLPMTPLGFNVMRHKIHDFMEKVLQ